MHETFTPVHQGEWTDAWSWDNSRPAEDTMVAQAVQPGKRLGLPGTCTGIALLGHGPSTGTRRQVGHGGGSTKPLAGPITLSLPVHLPHCPAPLRPQLRSTCPGLTGHASPPRGILPACLGAMPSARQAARDQTEPAPALSAAIPSLIAPAQGHWCLAGAPCSTDHGARGRRDGPECPRGQAAAEGTGLLTLCHGLCAWGRRWQCPRRRRRPWRGRRCLQPSPGCARPAGRCWQYSVVPL